tara:strand:- start:1432 stop:1635 length:204 start_codon:yes stop_codon:yes gene_type:complete
MPKLTSYTLTKVFCNFNSYEVKGIKRSLSLYLLNYYSDGLYDKISHAFHHGESNELESLVEIAYHEE